MSIIDGHQKKRWKIVEFFVTFFGWFVVLGFFTQILISIILWIFNLSYVYKELIIFGTIEDSIFILLTTLILSLLSFTTMYLWGRYNIKRFAHLDRRHFPEVVTEEELAKYFQLPESEVKVYSSEKYIVFERNIIKEN